MSQKRELNTDPTDFVIRGLGAALRLMHVYGRRKGFAAKPLALMLWPNSPGWTNARDLSGRQKGKGPVYAASNLLVRMERMGLAEKSGFEDRYRLTDKGLMGALDADRKVKTAQLRKQAHQEAIKNG